MSFLSALSIFFGQGGGGRVKLVSRWASGSVALATLLGHLLLCNKDFQYMYTSRLKDGRKKEKDATTNLFTRLLYYQQYTYIKNNDYLQLQKANRNKHIV